MTTDPKRPKVVIIGAGFGGLSAARALAGKPVEVTLIDRTNHHLFQPLLYQVATAGLSPADIAKPIRAIVREAKNIRVVLGEVTAIDPASQTVSVPDATFPYDYLIVAAGARHSYFGNPEWEKFAPGLKRLEDAIDIRRRLLLSFEAAEKATDPAERQKALTFVIVGAGPTGVEMAGSISELARHSLVRDFRRIDPAAAHVILLDAMPRVLPTFPEDLSAKALEHLRQLHVEVRLEEKVQGVSADGVTLESGKIAANTVIWAAGNEASALGRFFESAKRDRAGRVEVREDLSLDELPNVFVIGDMASFQHQTGKPLPGVSPVALQQGRQAARNILLLTEHGATEPFEYLDKGYMATIGRNKAVADLHFVRFGGFLAWLAWVFVHLIFLVGFRNRLLVLLQWVWGYLTFGKGARLITGVPSSAESP